MVRRKQKERAEAIERQRRIEEAEARAAKAQAEADSPADVLAVRLVACSCLGRVLGLLLACVSGELWQFSRSSF